MASDLDRDVVDLTRRHYRPSGRLDQFLGRFLRAVVAERELAEGSVRVQGFGSVRATGDGATRFIDQVVEDPRLDRIEERHPAEESGFDPEASVDRSVAAADRRQSAALSAGSGASPLATPLMYHEQPIGEVRLKERMPEIPADSGRAFLAALARELTYHVQRYRAGEQGLRSLGRDLMLVGTSAALREVDRFVESASRVDHPVVISGEFGVEKAQTAASIHFGSSRGGRPLAELFCPAMSLGNFDAELDRAFRLAGDGTLYLHGIDELPAELQLRLAHRLESDVGQWLSPPLEHDAPSPRIVVSCARDLGALAAEGLVCNALLAEVDFLRIHLPPLRERPEDIRPLVLYVLDRQGCDSPSLREGEFLELCESYAWPHNLLELRRTVCRLAAFTGGRHVGMDDVIRLAPEILSGHERTGPAPNGAEVLPPAIGNRDVASALLADEPSELGHLHPSLRRALRHLASRYDENVALSELAKVSCVSPSHLSHLFKSQTGLSFKPFLTRLRIERAKQLLRSRPGERITDIALQVGFGDLSHFEKTFKRLVGERPREYRLTSGDGDGVARAAGRSRERL